MNPQEIDYNTISLEILEMAPQFGFLEAQIARLNISKTTQQKFQDWIFQKFHGEMKYLEKNLNLRFNPQLLHEVTLSIICVKMPYLTKNIEQHKKRLLNRNNVML